MNISVTFGYHVSSQHMDCFVLNLFIYILETLQAKVPQVKSTIPGATTPWIVDLTSTIMTKSIPKMLVDLFY